MFFTFQVLSLCFSLFRCAFHVISLLRCFSCAFHFSGAFHAKCHFSCMKDHLLTFMHHQTHICVHRCTTYTYMHHMHQQTHMCTTKHHQNIHSWPSLCTLWNTWSKWEICVESAVFVASQCCFSLFRCLSWKAKCFSWKAQHFSYKVLWAFGWSPSIGLSFERPIKIDPHYWCPFYVRKYCKHKINWRTQNWCPIHLL